MTQLAPGLASVLTTGGFSRDPDGIYLAPMPGGAAGQQAELTVREEVAAQQYDDYLAAVANSHSVAVMDHEVDRYLEAMPRGAVILDVGGCWGWHWRRLSATRPDVSVLIVDFVRANLLHAKRVLGDTVGAQVALMHADATALPFPASDSRASGFDGVWSVQVFQHIPDFDRACREAYRVLKPGGRFATYSLHNTPFNRAVYRLLGKHFHTNGMMKSKFHLSRANDGQRRAIETIFGTAVADRFTESLFHPDLRLAFSGRFGSRIGALDARLGDLPWLARFFARQRSFEVTKV